MPPSPTTQRMGELHEVHLADVNGGRKSRGSGSQWDDQADGRNGHDGPFAFCWDGKSTRGQQIAVTLAMIAKIREQAQGERPQIGLRWYGNDVLDKILEDWIAVQGEDWREVLGAARKLAELEAEYGDLSRLLENPLLLVRLPEGASPEEAEAWGVALEAIVQAGHLPEAVDAREDPALAERLRAEIDALRDEAATARTEAEAAGSRWSDAMRTVATRNAEIELLRAELEKHQAAGAADARMVPGYVPQLPWTVINSVRIANGGLRGMAVRYDAQGAVTREWVATLRFERSVTNRPRIILDDTLVANGDVYIEGLLRCRAWLDHPEMEVG